MFLSISSAHAFPKYMRAYNELPDAVVAAKNDCSVCHINPEGGGKRHEFGQAFQKQGFKFTDELKKSFPKFFTTSKK